MSFLPKHLLLVASVCLFFVLTATPGQMSAQDLPQACQAAVQKAATAPDAERDAAIADLLKPGRHQKCYATIIAGSSALNGKSLFKNLLAEFEAVRTDKQAGSSTGTGGTTNLVSKGVAAQVLSFAAEHGALTESVNKNVVTVQGSLDGIPAVFIQQGLVPYCPESEPLNKGCLHQKSIDLLRRFSYGVSFDTGQQQQNVTATASGSAQGTAQPVTFTANQQQISQVIGKAMLLRSKESVASANFKKQWDANIKNLNDAQVGSALNSLWGKLIVPANKGFAVWLGCAGKDLGTAGSTDFPGRWLTHAQQLTRIFKGEIIQDPTSCAEVQATDPQVETNSTLSDIVKDSSTNADIEQAAAAALRALTAFAFNEQQFVDSLRESPVLTFEYNYNRQAGRPDNSTFRLIYGRSFGPNWSVTANGGFNLFNSQPTLPGAGPVAYTQAAAELDRNFILFGPHTASVAYYFQYQNSPAVLNVTPGNPLPGVTFVNLPSTATQVFAQKGNIDVAQLKLSMGAGNSNVKFPIAVTYSNRTELVAKPSWGGQIGVSYDFDALFAGK